MEAYNFWSGDKIPCCLTAILRQVILSREHDQFKFLQLTLLVIRKLLRVSHANKVAKMKNFASQCEQDLSLAACRPFTTMPDGMSCPKAVHLENYCRLTYLW